MRFCLNLKPTTNDVFWRIFLIFLYFFVHLLRAPPTLSFGKLLLFFIIKTFSKINTFFFSNRMGLRRLAKLYKNPRARLNLLLVRCRRINKTCPLWARTTTVFVFGGYLCRVNQVPFSKTSTAFGSLHNSRRRYHPVSVQQNLNFS